MGIETVGATKRRGGRGPSTATAVAVCALPSLAEFLSDLLGRAVTSDEVRDRAIAFGLLRAAGSGQETDLTAQNASRLLLATYRLPAQVESATWTEVCGHCQANRPVYLILRDVAGRETTLRADQLLTSESTSVASPTGPLFEAWTQAGNQIVVAARCWTDLPGEGLTFFAGSRDRDRSFHWNTAECDTDAEGNILRY
jgi:hypothetical protein